jgi:hypothetical protein
LNGLMIAITSFISHPSMIAADRVSNARPVARTDEESQAACQLAADFVNS